MNEIIYDPQERLASPTCSSGLAHPSSVFLGRLLTSLPTFGTVVELRPSFESMIPARSGLDDLSPIGSVQQCRAFALAPHSWHRVHHQSLKV